MNRVLLIGVIALTASTLARAFDSLGCFLDGQQSANYSRALPTFFCADGLTGQPPQCKAQHGMPYDFRLGSAGAYNMSYSLCNAFCQGYTYFGVEFQTQCYCGHELPSQGTADPSACNATRCLGNRSETCGGDRALNLFATTATEPVPTAAQPFAPVGCFLDVQKKKNYARVLPTYFCSNGVINGSSAQPWLSCAPQPNQPADLSQGYAGFYNMSHEVCNGICQGYTYFGIESGGECYCGADVPSQGTADPTACSMPCTGDSAETCGGKQAVDVFSTFPKPALAWYDTLATAPRLTSHPIASTEPASIDRLASGLHSSVASSS
jgi:hypothetical protein